MVNHRRLDDRIWERSALGVSGPVSWSALANPAREVYYKSLLDLHSASRVRRLGSEEIQVLRGRTAISRHPMYRRAGGIAGGIAQAQPSEDDALWLGAAVQDLLALGRPYVAPSSGLYELYLGLVPWRPVPVTSFFDVCGRLVAELVSRGVVGLVAEVDQRLPGSTLAQLRTLANLVGFERLSETMVAQKLT